MSKFYGVIQGGRGEATRTGHDGMTAIAASWEGAIHSRLYVRDGVTMAYVRAVSWPGRDTVKVLYDGPLSDLMKGE